jgi:hypothetical protein
MNQLLYRGPAIEALHQQYAKQGRIDERAPVATTLRGPHRRPGPAGLGTAK